MGSCVGGREAGTGLEGQVLEPNVKDGEDLLYTC